MEHISKSDSDTKNKEIDQIVEELTQQFNEGEFDQASEYFNPSDTSIMINKYRELEESILKLMDNKQNLLKEQEMLLKKNAQDLKEMKEREESYLELHERLLIDLEVLI